MSVQRTQTNTNSKIEFIGRAWINEVKAGKWAGTKFINVSLDRTIDSLTVNKGSSIQLWPNKKREGKEASDADYRVSIREQ